MKKTILSFLGRDVAGSLALALAVFVVFTWPLPAHITTAMPFGSDNKPETSLQRMWPGDHLQLMYHFWLFEDMAAGRTPWFHNVYEFNTGSDAARYEPESYYAPFSLFFAAGDRIVGRAFGWNLALFMSVWLSVFFCVRLARQFSDAEAAVWLAALVAAVLPYRWITILGGSPTGFAMAWVPLVFLGLSRAMRDFDMRAAWIAGFGMLFCALGDAHSFFFAALAIPFWCLAVLVLRDDSRWRVPSFYVKAALLLVPVGLLMAAGMLTLRTVSKQVEHAAMGAAGRTLREVGLFSPKMHDLFFGGQGGVAAQIYAGYTVVALAVIGLVLLVAAAVRAPKENARRLVFFLMLGAGIVLVFALALGPNGPHQGVFFRAARKLVPRYDFIRQSTKVLLLLPALVTVVVAIAAGEIKTRLARRGVFALVVAFFAVAVPFEFYGRAQPQLTVLDKTEADYAAVAADARARGVEPRAMVIPLWPGDSHYSSVYEYYASLYRIRMVNGYRPAVSTNYIQDVSDTLWSGNQGVLDDAQLDQLEAMHVGYIIFQENLFPDKVSPFAPPATLNGLMMNPRLQLIAGATPAKAFRILPKDAQNAARPQPMPFIFPARRFEAESCKTHGAEITNDVTAGEGRFVRFATPEKSLLGTPPVQAVPRADFRWTARMRGDGVARAEVVEDGVSVFQTNIIVHSGGWQWFAVPHRDTTYVLTNQLVITLLSGAVDVDTITCLDGPSPVPPPGGTVVLPAGCFAHGGRTVMSDNSVELDPRLDFAWTALFGPKWPWEPGRYHIVLNFETDAKAGVKLGEWHVEQPENHPVTTVGVIAGTPCNADVNLASNLPLQMFFNYSAAAKIRLKNFTITRLP